MGRGKLTLDLIEKEKVRMITYQKRKRGLIKKAQEFATLCGVPTGMIIYGPRLNNRPAADVEIWPKDHKEFMEVVNLYRDKAFSSIRGVKSQNLYDYFVDRNKKIYEKIVKTRKANFESKFSSDDLDEDIINTMSLHQLKEMLIVFDNNIDGATRKLALLKGHHQNGVGAQVLFQQPPQPLAGFHHVNMQLGPYYHHHSHHHHQALQMGPFEFNDNPMMAMMLMNGGDQSLQLASGAAPYYNHPTTQRAMYYDVMGAMIENRVMMNQFPPALPSIASHQVHGSQYNGLYDDYINGVHYKR